MTHERIRLGISACLLGEPVRFDGGHKRDPFLVQSLGQFVDWVPAKSGRGLFADALVTRYSPAARRRRRTAQRSAAARELRRAHLRVPSAHRVVCGPVVDG